MAIHRLDEGPGQPGHWFFLDLPKSEIEAIRVWCQANFGRPTRMRPDDAIWVPTRPERTWSMSFVPLPRLTYLVLWSRAEAALFTLFFKVHDHTTIPWLSRDGL